MLRRRLPFLFILLAALSMGSATASADVGVAFVRGEQNTTVKRPGSTPQDAIAALLRGPAKAELADGVRTYVPASTRLRSLTVTGQVATVDLSLVFATEGADDTDSLRARLTQVVRTLTGVAPIKGVRLLVEGGTPLGLFPGVAATAVLTDDYLEAPDAQAPKPSATAPAPSTKTQSKVSDDVQAAQQRLIDLGYLLAGDADGRTGPATQAAVIAFQKWEGLARDGVLGAKTLARLRTATRPTPITRGGRGKRAEVLIDRQVALAIQDDRVVRVLHVSTGKPSTPTPIGTFKVYAQFTRWWSTPFAEWLLWASPFTGGIAFHQLADVPVFAASHGCVRITAAQAKWMYDFLKVGTPVKVLAKS